MTTRLHVAALIRWIGVQPRSGQHDAQTACRVLGMDIIDLAQHALYIGGALRRREAALEAATAAARLATTAWTAERAIDKGVVVNATLEQAWQAWTTREGIVSFFAPDAQIEARVGGAFHIHFDPGAAPGAKGADDMRFMALQPMRMLSFDWNAPPHLAQARAQRIFVVLRFRPLGERSTDISLHHTGWGEGGEWDQAYAYFDRAWGNVLINLGKRFDGGPQDWSGWLKQLESRRAAPVASPAPQSKP